MNESPPTETIEDLDEQIAALFSSGRYEEALAIVDRAIEQESDNSSAHRLRADALYWLGNDGEALTAAERAIEIGPNESGAHCTRAAALYWTDRYEDAIGSADRAIELDGDVARPATSGPRRSSG